MVTVVSWKDLPRRIATSSKGVKKAGVKTLNDIAFSSLKPIVAEAERDMQFRGNARRALGWQVEKANTANMQATVKTNRGWFALHTDEGVRRPTSSGFNWNGQSWIFIPRAKGVGVVDRRGRLRNGAGKGLYLTPRGDHALVFYRQRKNKGISDFIGVAVKSAKYHVDTDWQAVIMKEWQNKAHLRFEHHLSKAY